MLRSYPSTISNKRWKLFSLSLALLLLLSPSGPAQASGPETVLVTGRPASTEFLQEVLTRRGWTHFPPRALRPGESWKSPQGFRVVNLDWTPPPTALAALSDHPEDVDRVGHLFSGGLTPHRPVRLQYYHLGSLRGPEPQLKLLFTNPGPGSARVYIRRAAGEPSLEYTDTGHGNNVTWFRRENAQEGEFVDIPEGEMVLLHRQPMPLEKVVSGTLEMTLVRGGPARYDFVSTTSNTAPLALNNLLKESDVHSRGFYPVALQRMERTFRLGSDEELRLAVGALRQETFYGVRELRGDYGVVYDLTVHLHNPTDRPRSVDLLLNPRGGDATATVLMEGELLEAPRSKAFAEILLTSLRLEPGERRTVTLRTIPEGASSYPVRFLFRESSDMTGAEGKSSKILEFPHVRHNRTRVSSV